MQEQQHICTATECPPFGFYYVSAIDAGKTYLMAGPYRQHADALADVKRALAIADARDGRAWFMSWGTVRLADGDKIGVLTKHGLMSGKQATL